VLNIADANILVFQWAHLLHQGLYGRIQIESTVLYCMLQKSGGVEAVPPSP
jgi:hypothetical protein